MFHAEVSAIKSKERTAAVFAKWMPKKVEESVVAKPAAMSRKAKVISAGVVVGTAGLVALAANYKGSGDVAKKIAQAGASFAASNAVKAGEITLSTLSKVGRGMKASLPYAQAAFSQISNFRNQAKAFVGLGSVAGAVVAANTMLVAK